MGAPLVDLSSHFIDRELAQVDAEIEKLLHESQLAQARLLVEEQRWLSPSMRLRPDRPSLERPTEALYAKQLGVLQTTRNSAAREPPWAHHCEQPLGPGGQRGAAGQLGGCGQLRGLGGCGVRGRDRGLRPGRDGSGRDRHGRSRGHLPPHPLVPRRGPGTPQGSAVEEAPEPAEDSLFRFPVYGLPVYVSVPPDCRLGVGQVLSVEFPRGVM